MLSWLSKYFSICCSVLGVIIFFLASGTLLSFDALWAKNRLIIHQIVKLCLFLLLKWLIVAFMSLLALSAKYFATRSWNCNSVSTKFDFLLLLVAAVKLQSES